MQSDSVAGNLLQADAADSAYLGTEIAAQQVFTQSDALEDLGSTIRTDRRDTHLTHNLLQALIHSLDVVGLCRGVLLLNLSFLYQIIEDGECHIWTECTGTIAQQQCRMHRLANLTTLHYQRGLHTLAHADKIMMNGAHSQQTWDGRMGIIDVTVREDDVVYTLVNTHLSLMAQVVESLT